MREKMEEGQAQQQTKQWRETRPLKVPQGAELALQLLQQSSLPQPHPQPQPKRPQMHRRLARPLTRMRSV
jgi:hypothetical protein